MNNYSSYNGYNYVNSNIILVTSLEEALYKTNSINSDMVYFHQTEHVFYRVKVNERGEKSWQTMNYNGAESDINLPVTKADIQRIEERLSKLEGNYEQSDGSNVV